MSDEKTIESLRLALEVSPDNVPLRLHLAEILGGLRKYEDAETIIRTGMAKHPADTELKMALANVFFLQQKDNEAIVLLETIGKKDGRYAESMLLLARLHSRSGNHREAANAYRTAIDENPELADDTLSEELGVYPSAAWGQAEQPSEPWRQAQPAGDQQGPPQSTFELERPDVSFDNVGGMESIKEEIRMKIIHPLTHPEIYKAYGKSIGGGILMYGPPGCGKTHLARATAGQVNAKFLSVGIHQILDMWIGNSEKQLHALFEQARRNSPCVLFFDEVDALGASRTDMKTSGSRHLINQFLSELDGVNASNEGVLILAATNAPWHLDSAFRRPGRFDRVLFVPPPDRTARGAILEIMLSGKPVDNIAHDTLAKKSDGFSGADLKAVIDVAIEAKLTEAMKAGIPKPLTTKDLQQALSKVKPSTSEWFSTAKNYALFSNQGGAYDDILDYLKLR
ncbi:ATP-binding protein [Rhodopirellula sp. MGV]|uniref:ATP-binding protein n=1 Tax=Rhodopirellula sp. MGV TaxID=2023130 RepID=UPI000B96222D|nr:ATP-binding protein [Rhodopirellula sp. MGV]OYP29958.1 cell division protein [Rhodopirellula sp. MGV]PNY33414.1 cell division protein [Rhodopirellula baltica]